MIENYDEYKNIINENLLYYMPNIDSKSEPLGESMR